MWQQSFRPFGLLHFFPKPCLTAEKMTADLDLEFSLTVNAGHKLIGVPQAKISPQGSGIYHV